MIGADMDCAHAPSAVVRREAQRIAEGNHRRAVPCVPTRAQRAFRILADPIQSTIDAKEDYHDSVRHRPEPA